MSRIILGSILAGLCQHVCAQEYFQRAFGQPQVSDVFGSSGAIRHTNGDWSMRGGAAIVNPVLRIGPDGNDLWTRHLSSAQFSTIGGIISFADAPANSVLVVRIDSIRVIGADLSERSFDVIKLTSAGNVEWAWQHTFTVPGQLSSPGDGHPIASAPDGHFYVYGGEPARPLLFRFTPSGQLSWVKELVATHPIGHVSSLTTDAAGSCILLADGSASFGDVDQVVVMKIAPTGTVQWSSTMQPSTPGRSFLPKKAIARGNGHTLVSGEEYGNFTFNHGVLIDVDMNGAFQWARYYDFNDGEGLTTYTADERSDGHLWLDFQKGGYGLVHLTPTGEVVDAQRFTYQILGNSLGVVAWDRKLIHSDHLGLVGNYFIDQPGTWNDPRCNWLWDLDAMAPDLCGTDAVTVTSTELTQQEIVITPGPSMQNATVSSQAITVTANSAAPAPNVPACAVILAVPQLEGTVTINVHPSLVYVGEQVRIQGAPHGHARILDATGRLLATIPMNGDDAALLPTDACAPGLHLLHFTDATGRMVAATRIMVR